mmetsp:Transcript_44167/g.70978  ORF Transcript_44167/g.70978 Transcript_44167/m.70978 type:complete len:609 (+) Transcript_44167:27-1853(+)
MPPKKKSAASDSDDSFIDDDSEDYDVSDDGSNGAKAPVRTYANWIPSNQPHCSFGFGCSRKNPKHFEEESHPSSHPLAKSGASGGGAASNDSIDWVPRGKTKCQFGSECTRANPKHFEEESHPSSHNKVKEYSIGLAVAGGGVAGGVRLVPAGLPACQYGLKCSRNNPNHFKEEAHPTSHPKVSELDLDDGSGNTVGGGGSGAGGGSGGDDRRFSSADEEHGEQEKKQARDKQREMEWKKDEEKKKKQHLEKEQREKDRGKEKEKKEKEDRERKEREKLREKAQAREKEKEKEKEKERERAGGAGATGGSGTKRPLDAAPPLNMAFVPRDTAAALVEETKKKAEQRQEEEQRQKEQDKQKAEEKQKKEEEEQEIFPLCIIKLGSAAGGEGHGDGAQSLALPLLCADSLWACDPSVAARAAMSVIKPFLAKHKEDALIRIVFVEEAGSLAFEALQAHNAVSDSRMLVVQSTSPADIAQLGEKGLPCGFIAVEADKLYYKGKRPTRSRAHHLFDKSGNEGSLGALGSATSARYKTPGKLAETYAVQLKASSPLLTQAKCHTVLHVIVPSRNPKHHQEDNYLLDDAAAFTGLKKCYSNLLDNFYHLSRTKP